MPFGLESGLPHNITDTWPRFTSAAFFCPPAKIGREGRVQQDDFGFPVTEVDQVLLLENSQVGQSWQSIEHQPTSPGGSCR
jgi:hypothetical protein